MKSRSLRKQICNLFVIGISSIALNAQQSVVPFSGSVQGSLVDETGQPAKGFEISIIGTSRTSTNRVEVQTDKNGNFIATGLKQGSYLATPHLDTIDSRYPPGTSAFFDKHLIRFLIDEEVPKATLSMKLDPPSLILSGTVTDETSGLPLAATINLWHQNDKDKWVRFGSSAAGKYRVWLPAGETIEVEVSAPGYQIFKSTIAAIEDKVDPTLDVKLMRLDTRDH